MIPDGPEVSLSHAHDRVAVAVSECGPTGVDVEPAGAARAGELAGVALTLAEAARLDGQDATVSWVRKEAVLKATGHGLTTDPALIEVSPAGRRPRMLAWNAPDRPALPLRLTDLDVGAGYVGCVAVITDARPRVVVCEVTAWGAPARTARR
jgi:4'-phosphopantetheinyl transferase